MRGGKRDNAGRKGYGPTKVYRLPIALDSQIQALLNEYKANFDSVTQSNNTPFDSVTQSKPLAKPDIPKLSPNELKRFQQWLVKHRFAKSLTQARKMTKTPNLCKETFLSYINDVDDKDFEPISDIAKHYTVD